MKYLLVLLTVSLLAGCANPMTRLLPKLDKIELPPELMEPPKPLKTIEKPPVQETTNVPPK